jgi:Tfp pilus assembly protein FimV
MPEETKKEAPAAPAPKADDTALKAAQAEVADLKKQLKDAEAKTHDTERKLKAAKSAPTGDVVLLGGKSWAVKGTVRASDALEEVRRGHIPEDVTLVIIDKPA